MPTILDPAVPVDQAELTRPSQPEALFKTLAAAHGLATDEPPPANSDGQGPAGPRRRLSASDVSIPPELPHASSPGFEPPQVLRVLDLAPSDRPDQPNQPVLPPPSAHSKSHRRRPRHAAPPE
jgi:hypothetical protein